MSVCVSTLACLAGVRKHGNTRALFTAGQGMWETLLFRFFGSCFAGPNKFMSKVEIISSS